MSTGTLSQIVFSKVITIVSSFESTSILDNLKCLSSIGH